MRSWGGQPRGRQFPFLHPIRCCESIWSLGGGGNSERTQPSPIAPQSAACPQVRRMGRSMGPCDGGPVPRRSFPLELGPARASRRPRSRRFVRTDYPEPHPAARSKRRVLGGTFRSFCGLGNKTQAPSTIGGPDCSGEAFQSKGGTQRQTPSYQVGNEDFIMKTPSFPSVPPKEFYRFIPVYIPFWI